MADRGTTTTRFPALAADAISLVIEIHGGIHIRPQMIIGIYDFHFHLHGGFRSVRFGRYFVNLSLIFPVRIGVRRHNAFLSAVRVSENRSG